MARHRIRSIAGGIVASVLLVGCARSPIAPPSATTNVFTVVAQEFGFNQPTLEAQVGHPMMVILQNRGTLTHDWMVTGLDTAPVEGLPSDGQDGHGAHTHAMFESEDHDDHGAHAHDMAAPVAHAAAAPGEQTTVMFTPMSAGVFTFICTVPGHEAAGMYGTLTVTK